MRDENKSKQKKIFTTSSSLKEYLALQGWWGRNKDRFGAIAKGGVGDWRDSLPWRGDWHDKRW